MSAQVLGTRVANALIEDAEVSVPESPGFAFIAPVFETVTPVLERFRRAYGGLWVGGRATLTATELRFHPNAANRSIHSGELTITIPLPAVVSVEVRRGFVTRIIAVETPGYLLRLRCFGAKSFAEQIRSAVGSASQR